MHGLLRRNNFSFHRLNDCLMAKAYAKNGSRLREGSYNFQTDSCLVGRAGARRNHNRGGREYSYRRDVDRVIANGHRFRSKLPEVAGKVVNKTVVVVDHQNHVRGLR